jgi:hypothetical protein
MIIKFAKDSREGACEYLANGTRGDRDKKDKRIQLTKDDCYNTIGKVNEYLKKTGKWNKYKDNYKHIVLSFNRDELNEQTLKNIVNDFVRLYMHAYNSDEYTFYAEAHMPKEKFNERGEERRPHVHIFIHKYSMKLDRRLRFLTHPQRRKELNLIKHYLIKKYNLNYTFTNKAISKSKLDFYTGKNINSAKELKNAITDYINSNLQNFTSFSEMIKSIEKTFNVNIKASKNAKTPYISIGAEGIKRNIRLKGLLFSADTFNLAKKSILENKQIERYEKEYYLSEKEILEQLKERQKLLKDEVNQRFSKRRLQIRKQEIAEKLNIDVKELNKIIFKLKILNAALNINLQNIVSEYKDLGVFNNNSELKLINKNKNININIKAEKGDFTAIANGTDEKAQAKILASILAEKIKAGELNQSDLIITGTDTFKKYINKFLEEELKKADPKADPEKQNKFSEREKGLKGERKKAKKAKIIDF